MDTNTCVCVRENKQLNNNKLHRNTVVDYFIIEDPRIKQF